METLPFTSTESLAVSLGSWSGGYQNSPGTWVPPQGHSELTDQWWGAGIGF